MPKRLLRQSCGQRCVMSSSTFLGRQTEATGDQQAGEPVPAKFLVEGARSAFARLNRSQHSFGGWMDQLGDKKHSNVAVVALANKMTRIAWAVLTTGQQCRALT